ncbi:hypothetical protein V1460_05035 [Streptomyces sp. SCSIO 30461]|uniref:hypothetical protein n=1 Tax=Streptomyces sp. SCSIO 30461 TaxID=3118085 RepID=UPI0030CBF4F6
MVAAGTDALLSDTQESPGTVRTLRSAPDEPHEVYEAYGHGLFLGPPGRPHRLRGQGHDRDSGATWRGSLASAPTGDDQCPGGALYEAE